MARRTLAGAGLLTGGALAVLLLAAPLTPPSAAEPSGNPLANAEQSGGGYDARVGSVTVLQSGGGPSGTRSYRVPGPPPLCWLEPGRTASELDPRGVHPAERADYYRGAPPASGEEHDGDFGGYVPEGHAENVANEAAGVEGRYWIPVCRPEATIEQRYEFYSRFPTGGTYVVGTPPQPPPPPLTVEQILEVVRDRIDVPEPAVGVNPATASLVNLDTWVWAEGGTFEPLTLRAESGPNWVEVVVTPRVLELAAPHARQTAPCVDGGTPWTGQDESVAPTCAVVFDRAPGGRAVLPLTVTSRWEAGWTGQDATGGRTGALPGVAASTVVDVTVGEVQTLVTDTR